MKLMRNPGVRRGMIAWGIVSIAAVLTALIWNVAFGVFTAVLCLILLAIHLVISQIRYRRIASLAADVDRILHGEDNVVWKQYAEGELEILQSELSKMTVRLREQQQKLQDDKVFLADSIADISHQIRTPLTTVNLLVSLLSDTKLSGERRQEICCELTDLLSRMEWLITSLLKFSKLDAHTIVFQKETLSLQELIEFACAPVLVPMELRGQTLCIQAEGNFSGDVSWTGEAIGNIVKNCTEHTPSGGRIEIVARETSLYSEILISDTGSGIAAEDLPHIFERFYKGKNSGEKSFGIGLALARMIVTGQNGTLKAGNCPDGGAIFTVRFYKGTV